MAMKLRRLTSCFLGMFLGLTLCSFSPNNINNAESALNNNVLRAQNVAEEASIDGQKGTLNEDLEVDIRNYAVTDLTASFQVVISFSDSANLRNNYAVGYYGEGEQYLPASLAFTVKDSNGNLVQRSAPINKVQSSNELFDGLGSNLGQTSISTFCDIDLAYGEEVLYKEGVQLLNVFFYDRESREVRLDQNTYCDVTFDRLDAAAYAPKYNVEDFFELTYTGSANYSGFSSFTFNVNDHGVELYPTFNTTTARAVRNNESDLESGKMYIKSTLNFSGTTTFILTYSDGSVQEIPSTNKNHEITNGGQVVLLLEGIDATNVVNVEIYDIYYQMNLFNVETNSNVSRTSASQRFGRIYTHMVDLKDSNGNVVVQKDASFNHTNGDLIVGLVFGISSILFFGSVIPAYFYLKQKNRNDEFKRMNTKSYVTTATYGYLCIESVLLLITYITIRATILNNTLTVYNPTDAFIVVFGVASIILIGYFIRYFVIMIKNNIEKKRRDRLNINQDVIDDGTLIIR